MAIHRLFKALPIPALCACAVLPCAAQVRNTAGDRLVTQTALSPCAALEVVSRKPVQAGTGLVVSGDGRFLATYIHTIAGAVSDLRERVTGEMHRVELPPPTLPAGIQWRIYDASFSPSGRWLAVRSVGMIWILNVADGSIAFSIPADTKAQIYPGKMAWGGDHLAVLFWPPESYLADADAKKPIEARIYDVATGNVEWKFPLSLLSADAWTEIRLSPDGARLAVLLRTRKWPGKSQLIVFAADAGKQVWEQKVGGEDLQWSGDGKQLLLLENDLVWLDAATGRALRHIGTDIHHSEYQKLRLSEPAKLAVGEFTVYSAFKRAFRSGERQRRLILWQLDPAKTLCEIPLDPATDPEMWVTDAAELIALETAYEIRPPLRLPKSAEIVTYRPAKLPEPAKPSEAEKTAKP